jgi:hypothetical protein
VLGYLTEKLVNVLNQQNVHAISINLDAWHNLPSQRFDCERNAAKRFIEHFKREHPHLKVIVIADGIASNAPYIKLLEENQRPSVYLGSPHLLIYVVFDFKYMM